MLVFPSLHLIALNANGLDSSFQKADINKMNKAHNSTFFHDKYPHQNRNVWKLPPCYKEHL